MLALMDQGSGPFVADEAEAMIARKAAEKLGAVVKARQGIKVVVQDDVQVVVPLPARAVAVILQVLEQMANRAPFSVIPHTAEFSTQQAADFMNVSRPFLTKLLDSGQIPHRTVGRHRRIKVGDLFEFEKKSKDKQQKALAELAEEARRLKLE
jgi:excisionase family DNA binding protein